MVDLDLNKLNSKYKNWRIAEHSVKGIVLVSKTLNNENEIPQIIDYLYTNVSGKKWEIAIDGFKIVAKPNHRSKYNRMYTSGAFDIFHFGHLNILIKSKELCDYLIVGVSTDELIEREKGKKPVIPFHERIKVVQSIGLVDEVIPQEDKNKQKIVDSYKIDAISVGDDWRGRYPKVSCAMEYFTYTANVSSTILKEALKLNIKKD
ncbi:adenylyltransferase/cytidyltransferase family protein [Maribacter sp. HTCC2170]|uniref:adenylyltransferase/cytidyltransferase family protein n=1 Tax=Maribacter sp. (strain HTCC2170 / KCCM 42371) TaxID=313603 RepID=UPI00006B2110|nr:adenylyltransferase/cytidyltransferase family protein [Maribacter sp. HTCC2170]EAR00169.1 probable glycerol-3-phosphate cytidyltransferase [Maribacter sp. HTCC2170]